MIRSESELFRAVPGLWIRSDRDEDDGYIDEKSNQQISRVVCLSDHCTRVNLGEHGRRKLDRNV
jgi:hypothetical protein